MRFWDSSAIVPLLALQQTAFALEGLLAADPEMLVCLGTSVECVSVLARLEREGALPPREAGMVQARLRALAQVWHEVRPHERQRLRAERLLRVHPLRAADALQLAAAIEAATALRSNSFA